MSNCPLSELGGLNYTCALIPCRERVISLESSLAKCLRVLSRCTDQGKEKSPQRAGIFMFSPRHVSHFLLTIRRIMCSVGISAYQTTELKVIICYRGWRSKELDFSFLDSEIIILKVARTIWRTLECHLQLWLDEDLCEHSSHFRKQFLFSEAFARLHWFIWLEQ